MIQTLPIESIIVGDRARKEAGDLDKLATSIRERGLLQPIAVWPDGTLACGWRRLLAAQSLGWAEIPVHVLAGRDDLVARLKAERDENECREPFTVTEAVAMGKVIEAAERPKAAERKGGRPKKVEETEGNFPSVSEPPADAGKTSDKVGEAIGMSGKTYEKAKAVIEAAEEDPETFGHLPAQMDQTGKVDPAYQEVQQTRKQPDSGPTFAQSIADILADGEWHPLEWLKEELKKAHPDAPERSLDIAIANSKRKSVSDDKRVLSRRVGKKKHEVRLEAGATQQQQDGRNGGGRPPVGTDLADEAIGRLKRIPMNDPLRKRGFQMVIAWIRSQP